MLREEYQPMTLDDFDMSAYIKEFEGKDMNDAFGDVQLSDFVLDNESTELLPIVAEYTQANHNDCLFDTPQGSVAPTDTLVSIPEMQLDNIAIVDTLHLFDDDFEQNFSYDLYEEIVAQQGINQVAEQLNCGRDENPFESITDTMVVKEQPKADQRARYESDGPRFLPDARKHPTSIQLPDLTEKPCKTNETYGIIVTMVTSTNNPKNRTFVHVNGIRYRTDDAIELANGGVFLPITEADKKSFEKIFPRLSKICKKVDEYTFDLTTFNPSTDEDAIIKKYTLANEDGVTKAAKGKQFIIDYDLLCYKLVFQLAFKQDDNFLVSHIKCETNIINEQKAPTKGVKRKASSDEKTVKKRKSTVNIQNAPKKSKALPSALTERLEEKELENVIRTSNRRIKRSQGSSVDSSSNPCGMASSAIGHLSSSY